jgi:hypothetical protein
MKEEEDEEGREGEEGAGVGDEELQADADARG